MLEFRRHVGPQRDALDALGDADLEMVSAVFLPLGFLTGLMGINLGGMPEASSPIVFWFFSGGLVLIAVLLQVLLRRMRMF